MTVDHEDWRAPLPSKMNNASKNIFHAAGHDVSSELGLDELKKVKGQKHPWQAAGPNSHWRSAACARLLMEDRCCNWEHLGSAWAGQYLGKGKAYAHLASGAVFLSLGFQFCAAQGWEMSRISGDCGGKAWMGKLEYFLIIVRIGVKLLYIETLEEIGRDWVRSGAG